MVVMPTRCWNCLDLQTRRGAQFSVEVRERFVEQQDGRFTHQRARERDALALAAGKLARPPIEQMRDTEQLRRPLDFLVDFGAGNALRLQWKSDVVSHRKMRIEAVALEHHGHAAGARWNIVDDVATDQEVAARLFLEPTDDAQIRRFATARRAEQHHELAVRHRQTDAIHSGNLAKFLDDIPGHYRSH